jgi:DNA-directed RNA polymerase specialized sigma24 family protein
MSTDGSVTHWISLVKDGDPDAAQQLWGAYFSRLVGLARAKLRGARRRAEDEEDAALSAFDSFCRGAERGRFPQLNDRQGLWQLLVVITARKAADLQERERRLKRGGGGVRGDSALIGPTTADFGAGWEEVVGSEPTPEFAAQAAEECRRLLAKLTDDELRMIALWKMEGYTNSEIAGRLHCSPPTVGRRLRLIRQLWDDEAPGGLSDAPAEDAAS